MEEWMNDNGVVRERAMSVRHMNGKKKAKLLGKEKGLVVQKQVFRRLKKERKGGMGETKMQCNKKSGGAEATVPVLYVRGGLLAMHFFGLGLGVLKICLRRAPCIFCAVSFEILFGFGGGGRKTSGGDEWMDG